MADYKFVTYEKLDSGKVARIMLNRPEARERPEPRAPGRPERRLPRGGGGRRGPGRHPGRHGPDVLLGTRHGLQGLHGGGHAGAEPALHAQDQRRDAQGCREPDAPGVALLLREHASLAQSAQNHHRAGARRRVRRRPHAPVGLRPHRLRRGHTLRRRRGDPPGHVRDGVLRPPVGVRPAQGEGAAPDRRLHRRRGGARPRHGQQDLPRRRPHAADARSSPSGSPSCRP